MRSFTKKNVEYTSDLYRFLYDEEDKYKKLRDFLKDVVQTSNIALFKSGLSGFEIDGSTDTKRFDVVISKIEDDTLSFINSHTDELEIIERIIKTKLSKSDDLIIKKIAKILFLQQILEMVKVRLQYDDRFTYYIKDIEEKITIKTNMILNQVDLSLAQAPWDENKDKEFIPPQMISYASFNKRQTIYDRENGSAKNGSKKPGLYFYSYNKTAKKVWQYTVHDNMTLGKENDRKESIIKFLKEKIVSKEEMTKSFNPKNFLKVGKKFSKTEDWGCWEKFLVPTGYKDSKQALILAEGLYCAYCETCLNDGINMDVEHKIPKSVFPTESLSWENFVVACKYCNEAFKSNNFIAPTLLTSKITLKDEVSGNEYISTNENLYFNLKSLTIESKPKIFFEEMPEVKNAEEVEGDYINTSLIIVLSEENDEMVEVEISITSSATEEWKISANINLSKNELMDHLYKNTVVNFLLNKFKDYTKKTIIKNDKDEDDETQYEISAYKEEGELIDDITYGVSGLIYLQKKNNNKKIEKYILTEESFLNIKKSKSNELSEVKLKIDSQSINFEPIDIKEIFEKDGIPAVIGDNTITFCAVKFPKKRKKGKLNDGVDEEEEEAEDEVDNAQDNIKEGYRFKDDFFRKGYLDAMAYAKNNVIWPDIENNEKISFEIFDYALFEDSKNEDRYDIPVDSISLNNIDHNTRITLTNSSGYKMKLENLNGEHIESNIRVMALCKNVDIHEQAFEHTVELCGLNKLGRADVEEDNVEEDDDKKKTTKSAKEKKDEKKKDAGRYYNDQRILRRTKAWLHAMKQLRLLQYHFNEKATLFSYYEKNLDLFKTEAFPNRLGNLEIKLNEKKITIEYAIKESTSTAEIIKIEHESKEITYKTNGNKIIGKYEDGYFKGTFEIIGDITEITMNQFIDADENETIKNDFFENGFFEWDNYQQKLLGLLDKTHTLLSAYVWENILDMVRVGGFYSTWVRTFEKYSKGEELQELNKRFDLDLVRDLEVSSQENQADPFQFHGTDALQIIDYLEKEEVE